jgi:hypothetical protein
VGVRSDSVQLVPYVFSFRCVCYVHDVIYIFSCRLCRYDLGVRFVTVIQFRPQLNISNVFRTVEYQPEVFNRVYQTLQDTGTLPGVRIAAELDVYEGVNEEGIVLMAQSSPRASTRRIARRLPVPHTRVWRTLHAEGKYP